ncbi:hypothetical protein VKA52_13695 [Halobacillus sp. HZG1]|uniref:hypothetical protein n=1 Tax=Halobacillus sp. HZG1 TaxID=3111769 RepID=UPI002DB712D9|nr:hypothetical protein [Halobacillus sp. HZG1]MEC3884782.1 hypothetical protein [Halobacillus sp. HZG1]
MNRIKDFTTFQWIIDETERIDFENGVGSRVENFIPSRFTHYAKLMHPIYLDENIKDTSILWSQCNPDEEVSFNFGERILMKDLAEAYELRYTKEFSFASIYHWLGGYPRYILGPAEDTMDEKLVPEVVRVLQPFTGVPCYFQYDLVKVKRYEENHGYGYLYRGELTEVEQFTGYEEVHDFPNYWYPESKNWCLFTGIDFNFTLFGGNKKMLEALQANAEIECMEVDKRTRVDDKADVHHLP